MKKICLLFLFVSLFTAGTTSQAQSQEVIDLTIVIEVDASDSVFTSALNGLLAFADSLYVRDSIITASNLNADRTFDKSKAKIYFVKEPETPDYYVFDNSETGTTWNGYAFWGYQKGKWVYFLEEYEVLSGEFADSTGQCHIVTENKFLVHDVTIDPRKTHWWSHVLDYYSTPVNYGEDIDLVAFLFEATAIIYSDDPVPFRDYLIALAEEIFNCEGKTVRQKIENYTAEVVPPQYY